MWQRPETYTRVQTVCNEPSKTQQQFKDDADINVLVRRWLNGTLPPVPTSEALYADFSNVGDFLQAQLQICAAADAFSELPSEIRARFAHDPGKLLQWLDDPDNLEEATQLGFFEPEQPGEPVPEATTVSTPGGETLGESPPSSPSPSGDATVTQTS